MFEDPREPKERVREATGTRTPIPLLFSAKPVRACARTVLPVLMPQQNVPGFHLRSIDLNHGSGTE